MVDGPAAQRDCAISKLRVVFYIIPMLVLGLLFRAMFDVADRDRDKTPDIHANVTRIAAAHPLIVDMAEQVQRALSENNTSLLFGHGWSECAHLTCIQKCCRKF